MSKRAIQTHHIYYNPPYTVVVYQGEHQCLTLMERYSKKTLSKGFLRALRFFILDNAERAIELKKEEK